MDQNVKRKKNNCTKLTKSNFIFWCVFMWMRLHFLITFFIYLDWVWKSASIKQWFRKINCFNIYNFTQARTRKQDVQQFFEAIRGKYELLQNYLATVESNEEIYICRARKLFANREKKNLKTTKFIDIKHTTQMQWSLDYMIIRCNRLQPK